MRLALHAANLVQPLQLENKYYMLSDTRPPFLVFDTPHSFPPVFGVASSASKDAYSSASKDAYSSALTLRPASLLCFIGEEGLLFGLKVRLPFFPQNRFLASHTH